MRHSPARTRPAPRQEPGLALSSASGRWLVAASALGSGLAFLDSTVVNVALPAIGRELGGGLSVQQWVLTPGGRSGGIRSAVW